MAESRKELLRKLKEATHQYAEAEKARIEEEVAVLEAVLDGRTGGRGLQRTTNETVTAVAKKDLAAYLGG